MSEQTIETPQQYPEQLSDILLVMDKEKKKIQAVTGIDENGNLKTVDADKKNQSQFMRVDKSGDIFSNFFSNFWRQLKDPTHFSFFKVPAGEAEETAKALQQQVDASTKEGEAVIAKHEVKEPKEQQQQQENKKDMETTQAKPETSEYRYKPEQIDWETMNNIGLSKERLEKEGVLDSLLRGYKTNTLIPISINLGSAVTRMDARLSLQPGENGNVVVEIHGVRQKPNLNIAFFGHEFTKDDKDSLLKSGNMGRVVELTNPKTGEKIPSIISIDRLTNEVIALRQEWIKIPDEIKGVKLNDEQKQTLREGKPLYLDGLDLKNTQDKSAYVQFNADRVYVEFLFGDRAPKQVQGNEPLRKFRGKEFSDEQYQKLTEGKTIYVTDFKDGKGQPYKGYVTLNAETGKFAFDFKNPDNLKNKVQPAEASKTRVAVNSDGKTNEATKNIKEPLKSEQQTPKDQKQQQQQKPKVPAKSKGIKR